MSEPRFLIHTFKDMRIPRDPSKAVPGIFYHGIIHGSYYGWYAEEMIKRNMYRHEAPGILVTPNYNAYLDPNYAAHHKSICNQEIEELKLGQNRGGVTPRAIEHLINGSDPMELDFEDGRRRISPESPSRLDCLYVADNEDTIRQMFSNDPNLIILKVHVVEALRFKKADHKWYNIYCTERNPQYIENYWRSQQYNDGDNNWEYLVDGLIMVDDPEGIETLTTLWSEDGPDDD